MNQEEKKLDKTGDSSQTVTLFEEEVLRENIESGEILSLSHGKIKKWFSEMKDIAFSGRASDIETDGANRFVSDGEKRNWNSKYRLKVISRLLKFNRWIPFHLIFLFRKRGKL